MKKVGNITYPDFDLMQQKYEDGKKYWSKHVQSAFDEWGEISDKIDCHPLRYDYPEYGNFKAVVAFVVMGAAFLYLLFDSLIGRFGFLMETFAIGSIICGIAVVLGLFAYRLLILRPLDKICSDKEDKYFEVEAESYAYGWDWDDDSNFDGVEERIPTGNNKYEFVLWLKALYLAGVKTVSLCYDIETGKYTIEVTDEGKEATLTFRDVETIDVSILDTFDFTCLEGMTFIPQNDETEADHNVITH